MREHPFAILVSSATGRLSADHVPLAVHPELSKVGIIRGHIAAGNPLCRESQGAIDALAVFQGPHAYVSPGWYTSKQEHGKAVPTWNYAVVHAHGTLRFCSDEDWLKDHLADLTTRHEAHRSSPWAIADAPDEYIARMLQRLVGFEIDIETLSGTWKMSQNKSDRDREGVASGLLAENSAHSAAVSQLVKGADN